jgi:hypothetical protein
MLDNPAAEALFRSFMLGTARQPAPAATALQGLADPGDPKAALKALALVGQRQRFRRPARIAATAPAPLFADPREPVPEAARPLLKSLLAGRGGDHRDAAAQAIADAMARRHLKLHPFDLPRLESFLQAESEKLGASAVAWMERRSAAPQTERGYFDADAIDESNWQHARPAQKAAFIRSLRGRDAAHARALVETALPGEQAPARLALVKALAEGLGPDDHPLLESLAKDRAPTVRDAAAALLAKLPGSPQSASRLADALGRIKQTKAGLINRRIVLKLDYPATVKDGQHAAWAVATFAGLGLKTLADALKLSVEAMVAAADDPGLTAVFAQQAAAERRFELLHHLVRNGAGDAWMSMAQAGELGFSDPDAIAAWSAAAIAPELWQDMPAGLWLQQLHGLLRMPLPPQTAQQILVSRAWRRFREATQHEKAPSWAAELTTALAALMPAGLRPALRENLSGLPPELTARAGALLMLLDLIDPA